MAVVVVTTLSVGMRRRERRYDFSLLMFVAAVVADRVGPVVVLGMVVINIVMLCVIHRVAMVVPEVVATSLVVPRVPVIYGRVFGIVAGMCVVVTEMCATLVIMWVVVVRDVVVARVMLVVVLIHTNPQILQQPLQPLRRDHSYTFGVAGEQLAEVRIILQDLLITDPRGRAG